MDHRSLQRLVAGAALGDLDPTERERYRRHHSGCAECRRLERELSEITADLSLAVPQRRPPASLAKDVLAAIAAVPRTDGVAGKGATGATTTLPMRPPLASLPGGRRGEVDTTRRHPAVGGSADAGTDAEIVRLHREASHLRRLGSAALAAVAVLAIAVTGLAMQVSGSSADLTAARAVADRAETDLATRTAAMSAAMAVALDPAHRTAPLHGEPVAPAADAVVVYRPGTEDAFLVATDLPPTPAGHVYQLWVADGSGVHGLGTYGFDGQGAFVAPIGWDLTRASAAMVTLEADGGARGEPGPEVVFGEL
jgi:hypothetical protein